MKKIISVLMCAFILMTSATVFATAHDNGVYVYEIGGTEYTVEITDNSVPAEKQELIAQSLVGLKDESVQQYGLGCVLFGHDYKYTVSSVVTHKVRSYAPRCKRETYDVTYCEDCDYTEQTLASTAYIDCCPVE